MYGLHAPTTRSAPSCVQHSMSYDFQLECEIVLNAYVVMLNVKLVGRSESSFLWYSTVYGLCVSSLLVVCSCPTIPPHAVHHWPNVRCWLLLAGHYAALSFRFHSHFGRTVRLLQSASITRAHIKRAIAMLLFTFWFPLISFPYIFMAVHKFGGHLGTSRVTKTFIQP